MCAALGTDVWCAGSVIKKPLAVLAPAPVRLLRGIAVPAAKTQHDISRRDRVPVELRAVVEVVQVDARYHMIVKKVGRGVGLADRNIAPVRLDRDRVIRRAEYQLRAVS